MIHIDEPCIIVCSQETAELLTSGGKDFGDSLIITNILKDPKEAIVVPKQDFLDWLYEEGEYASRV